MGAAILALEEDGREGGGRVGGRMEVVRPVAVGRGEGGVPICLFCSACGEGRKGGRGLAIVECGGRSVIGVVGTWDGARFCTVS